MRIFSRLLWALSYVTLASVPISVGSALCERPVAVATDVLSRIQELHRQVATTQLTDRRLFHYQQLTEICRLVENVIRLHRNDWLQKILESPAKFPFVERLDIQNSRREVRSGQIIYGRNLAEAAILSSNPEALALLLNYAAPRGEERFFGLTRSPELSTAARDPEVAAVLASHRIVWRNQTSLEFHYERLARLKSHLDERFGRLRKFADDPVRNAPLLQTSLMDIIPADLELEQDEKPPFDVTSFILRELAFPHEKPTLFSLFFQTQPPLRPQAEIVRFEWSEKVRVEKVSFQTPDRFTVQISRGVWPFQKHQELSLGFVDRELFRVDIKNSGWPPRHLWSFWIRQTARYTDFWAYPEDPPTRVYPYTWKGLAENSSGP
jgi:hypothetical protein